MDAIRIRHCKLHLRRKGGWSWGRDPDRLLQRATRALPELIARQLQHLLADRREPVTIDRLCINIPVGLSELATLAPAPDKNAGLSLLSERVSRQFKQALAEQAGIERPASVAPAPAATANKITPAAVTPVQKADAISLLVEWYRQGTLLQRLKYFSYQAVSDWERLALESLPGTVEKQSQRQFSLTEAEAFSRNLSLSLNRPAAPHTTRLLVLASLWQRYPGAFSKQTLVELLDRSQASAGNDTGILHKQAVEKNAAGQAPHSNDNTNFNDRLAVAGRHAPAATSIRTHGKRCFEVQVSSVLPFVALGILARLGYFEVLATALKAGGVEKDTHCFAIALACKTLAPPQRGWYREAADLRTAAAVAGLEECITGEEMERFAFNCRHCLSPADAHLKCLLAEGHNPACALLIHRRQQSRQPLWLLLDTQGCFPIGWFSEQASLLQALADFTSNTFLISAAAAEPGLFTELSARRHRFVTPLPPGRDDKWRPVDRRRQLWTNDLEAQAPWLLKQSRCLPAAIETAEEITEALIGARPVVPSHAQWSYALQFDQSLALAAASALATVAWELWGGGEETTDPVLALQRLGNLEGKVVVDSETLTVHPALGQRYRDLYRHDFFLTVNNLPWLGGRRVEFAGL